MHADLELAVPPGPAGLGVVVTLVLTRSELLSARTDSGAPVPVRDLVLYAPAPPDGTPLRLGLEYLGEPPSVRCVTRGDQPCAAPATAPRSTRNFARRQAAAAATRARAEALAAADAAGAAALLEQARAEAFFHDYDERTFPAPDLPCLAQVRRVHPVLVERLRVRWQRFQAAQAMAPPATLPSADAADVRLLSGLQLEIMRRHYPGADHGLDLPALERAFRLFAAARLGRCVPDPEAPQPARPDSANAFLFAEFALQVVDLAASTPDADLAADAAAWQALLPALVAVQLLYRRTWGSRSRPCSPPEDPQLQKRFSDYGPARDPPLDDATIAATLDGYALQAEPGLIHARNISLAFGLGVD